MRQRFRPKGRIAAWFAAIAQLVEHVIRNDGVTGSSPVCGTITQTPLYSRWTVPEKYSGRTVNHPFFRIARLGYWAVTLIFEVQARLLLALITLLGGAAVGSANILTLHYGKIGKLVF
jgi:hypothetical protein